MKSELKRNTLTVIFILLLAGIFSGKVNAESIDIYEQQKITSHLLVNLFMEQIAKDGLLIFGHEVSQSDLHSHHVSYIHDISSNTIKVQLCFTLAEPIAVPESDDFIVNKVTVDMDQDGNIIEISTHVFPVDQGQQKSE